MWVTDYEMEIKGKKRIHLNVYHFLALKHAPKNIYNATQHRNTGLSNVTTAEEDCTIKVN